MGVFDRIKDAIWGKQQTSTPPVRVASANAAPSATPSSPQPTAAPSAPAAQPRTDVQAPAAPRQPAPASQGAGQTQSSESVDVAAILDAAVKSSGQKLDWRRSIVDLMKALDLDSSLSHRKELAKELNYTGDTNDSATMNVWLHKALMKKLAENGGKVPPDLAD